MPKPVNVGFVGCGNFVTGNHLPNIHNNPAFHIRALCDVRQDALHALASTYHPDYVTGDYRKVVADGDIEAVIIGVHDERWPFVRDAVEGGKDVFVEKPMSLTMDETCRITALMASHPERRLMVGFNRRFAPIMQDVKRALSAKRQPAMILYRIVDNAKLWPDHVFDLNKGGGKLIYEAVHIFDLLRWLTESEPVHLYAEGAESDNDIITLRFANGAIAAIFIGGLGSRTYPKELLEVFSDGATIAAHDFLELKVHGIPDAQDKMYPLRLDAYADRVPGEGIDALRQKLRLWEKEITHEEYERRAYYASIPTAHKGHYEEMSAFAQAIRNGAPSPCDENDGAKATILALKARESIRTGLPVDVRREMCETFTKTRAANAIS